MGRVTRRNQGWGAAAVVVCLLAGVLLATTREAAAMKELLPTPGSPR